MPWGVRRELTAMFKAMFKAIVGCYIFCTNYILPSPLKFPTALKLLHNVFHINLLEPTVPNTIPNRRQPPPPPVEIDETLEYEVSAILDSRKHRNQLQYLVEWAGYEGTLEHHTWEPLANVKHAMDYVCDFHRRYPRKPKD